MTAYHVLEDADEKLGEIEVCFNDDSYSVSLHKLIDEEYKNLDVAILELEEEVDFYQNIDFFDKKLDSKERWITRGYPQAKRETGEELTHEDCVIHQHLDELSSENYDIELNLHDKFDSYGGLSGSPIIVDEKIVGFLTKELSDSGVKELRGLSFKYFQNLIDEVKKEEQKENEIIDTLKNGKYIELIKVELEDNRTLYVSKYPVTFEEYDLFCEETTRCKEYEPNNCGWGRGKKPVINVSLNDAIAYCHWLTDKSNKGITYILPTLEDWLSISNHHKQKEISFKKCAWYGSKETTINVDDKKIESDNLGIMHLYGNISEWCIDEFVVGGSFQSSCIDFLLENEKYEPIHTHETIGFRIIHKKF